MRIVDLRVPEIGGFANVIRLLVQPGDAVTQYTPIVTLESEEATFDVPARFVGTVHDVEVKLGDTVTEGSPLASIQITDSTAAAAEDTDDVKAVTTRPHRPSAKNPLRVAILVAVLGLSLLAWMPAAWQELRPAFFTGDAGTGAIFIPAPSQLGWELVIVTIAVVAWVLADLVKPRV